MRTGHFRFDDSEDRRWRFVELRRGSRFIGDYSGHSLSTRQDRVSNWGNWATGGPGTLHVLYNHQSHMICSGDAFRILTCALCSLFHPHHCFIQRPEETVVSRRFVNVIFVADFSIFIRGLSCSELFHHSLLSLRPFQLTCATSRRSR